jgi:hypothetical protein
MLSNQGDGIMRFNRPKNADPIFKNNKEAIKELLNLVTFGLNTNRYLNNRLNELKNVGIKLNNAIIHEYGEKFD